MDGPSYPITSDEIRISKDLPSYRSKEFRRSRGCLRRALTNIYDMDPLKIPLSAPLGKPPRMENGFGHISLSHTKEAILIGWSTNKIGVDIELKKRDINAEKIMYRYFSKIEIENLRSLNVRKLNLEVLKYWVLKEACIKWQEGNLSKDIMQWEINKNKNKSIHSSLSFDLNIKLLKFNRWYLGIASNENMFKFDPILCNQLVNY